MCPGAGSLTLTSSPSFPRSGSLEFRSSTSTCHEMPCQTRVPRLWPSTCFPRPAATRTHSLLRTSIARIACTTRVTHGSMPTRVCLPFSHTHIGHAGVKAIARAVAGSTSLQVLDLRGVNMRTEAALALAVALRSRCPMQSLLLGDNPGIGDTGVSGVAACLHASPTLSRLDVSRCGATVASVEELMASMVSPSLAARGGGVGTASDYVSTAGANVEVLSVAGNAGVGDAGAEAVAASLHMCPLLSSLDMSDCGIGDAGAREFAAAIYRATGNVHHGGASDSAPRWFLTHLDLRRNHISAGVCKQLQVRACVCGCVCVCV